MVSGATPRRAPRRGNVVAGSKLPRPAEQTTISRPGKDTVRCFVCDQITRMTPKSGRLAKHLDGDGNVCPNRDPNQKRVVLTELPPVSLPYNGRAPRDVKNRRTGFCHSCDQPITGERVYCGPCLAKHRN